MKWYKLLKDYETGKAGQLVELDDAAAALLIKAGVIDKDAVDKAKHELEEHLASFQKNLEAACNAAVNKALASVNKGIKVEVISEPIDRDPLKGFKNFGVFALDVKGFGRGQISETMGKYLKYCEEVHGKAPTGQSELIGEDGGVFVMTEIANELWKKAFPESDMTSRVDNRQINGAVIEYPYLVENSRANGSRHGGVTGYWLSEAGQMTGTKATGFKRLGFKLEKLGVLVYTTDELAEDGADTLGQELLNLAPAEIRFMINDAIYNGNGIKKPRGLMQSPALITVTRTTANKVKADDILNMYARFPAWLRNDPSTFWAINQEVEPQLDAMFLPAKNVAGTENVGGWPVYMPPGGLTGQSLGMLKGKPVVPIEFAAALGTTGDIMLCCGSQYRLVTKRGAGGGIQTAQSIHLRFDYNEQAWRFIMRVDGSGMWQSAVTPYKGSNTLSPFVVLS